MAVVNVFFMLLSFVFSGFVSASCPENEISLCKNELVKLKTSDSMMSPITEETLKDLCRMEEDVIDCIDDYASRCLRNSSLKIYEFLTSGTRRLFDAMCSESSRIRDDYIKHAECLRPIRGDVVYCVENQEKSLRNLNTEILGDDIQTACCFYLERVKCASETARKYCGAEAAELMEYLLSEPEGTPFNKKCSRKYSACRTADTCNSNPALFQSYYVTILIILGIILSLTDIL